MTDVSLVPIFTTAGLAAVANATANGLQAEITHVAIGDQGYAIRDASTGAPTAGALARVALASEKVRVAVSAGGATGPNEVLVEGTIPAAAPGFFIREVGFFLSDGTLLAVWSDAALTLGYRGELAPWFFKFILAWSSLPANAISVVFDGDAGQAGLALDVAQIDAKVRHTVEVGGGLEWADGDNALLTEAVELLIATALGGLGLADYLKRDVSDVLTAGFFTAPVVLPIVGGVVTPDLAAGNVFVLSGPLTSNLTLAMPDEEHLVGKAGMMLVILAQDATGGRTLTLAPGYHLAGGSWSSAPNAVNLLWITSDGSGDALDVVIAQRGE